MKKIIYPILLMLFLSTLNCSTAPPKSKSPESSAIAITVGLTIHSSLLQWEIFKAEKIYFARFNGNIKNIKVEDIVVSNYYTEGFANWRHDSLSSFLLNAKPGKYIAFAAYGKGKESEKEILVFFPKDVVKSSIITVKPGSMSYMGKYIMTTGALFNGMKEADDVQNYYYNLIAPYHKDLNFIIKELAFAQFVAPRSKEIHDSSKDKKEFLNDQLGEFKDTEWINKIKKGLMLLK